MRRHLRQVLTWYVDPFFHRLGLRRLPWCSWLESEWARVGQEGIDAFLAKNPPQAPLAPWIVSRGDSA